MDNNRNRPFYLRKSKNATKSVMMAAGFIAILALMNPLFFIAVPVMLLYGYYVYKKGKDELQKLIDLSIDLYDKNETEACLNELEKVLRIDESNEKACIIFALVKYSEEEYEEVIRLLERIEKEKLKNELDLEMKFADSYLKTKSYEKAVEIYKVLLKLQPKSLYLKNAIKECEREGHF